MLWQESGGVEQLAISVVIIMLAYLLFDTMLFIMHTVGLLLKTLVTFRSTELF